MKSNGAQESILLLCDIRSEENVGSLFRTADAAGIKKIYLCGITPSPIDRFGRVVGKIAKTALGAEKTLVWEKVSHAPALLRELKKNGYYIVAIEQSIHSVDYKNVPIKEKTVFILGNEIEGLSEDVLFLSDVIAEIPMKGKKESLNVSVAGGIVLFRMLNV